MKKILNYKTILSAIVMTLLIASCSLNEFNPSTVDLNVAYTTPEGFESLITMVSSGSMI